MASMVTAMKTTVDVLNDFCDENRFQALFEEAVMLCRESDVPFPEHGFRHGGLPYTNTSP